MRKFLMAMAAMVCMVAVSAKADTIRFTVVGNPNNVSLTPMANNAWTVETGDILPGMTPVPLDFGTINANATDAALDVKVSLDGVEVTKTLTWLPNTGLIQPYVFADFGIVVEVKPMAPQQGGDTYTLSAQVTDTVEVPVPASVWTGLVLLGGVGINSIRRRISNV